MTGLVRKATIASACALLIAGVASANVPSPANCDAPAFITVVGTNPNPSPNAGGAGFDVDPRGDFTVVVRDASNNPIQNSSVVVDFSLCSDIVLCQSVVTGQLVDCVTKTVRGLTDVAGSVTLAVVGASNNTGAVATVAAPGCGANGVKILADGVNISPGAGVTAAVFDQNGAIGGNGVNALDLSLFSDDVGSAALNATYRARSDYNYDLANSGLDLSVFADELGAAALGTGSGLGCFSGTYCP